MAGFNQTYLKNLMEQLEAGTDMLESLEKLNLLDIPLSLADQHQMVEKLRSWKLYGRMGQICSNIIQKIQSKAEAKEKEQAKKDKRNAARREKRRADKALEVEAKKVKLETSEEQKENVATKDSEVKKLKVEPKKKKPTSLMMKCQKQAKSMSSIFRK